MSTQNKIGVAGLSAMCVVFLVGIYAAATYNALIRADQQVQSQWAQVENVYQRRQDLVPNLVATVQGAAGFEKSAYLAVTEARSKVGQVAAAAPNPAGDPAQFAKVQAAQDNLSSALSRMMVVVENHPDLKATENFRDLQAQLEGAENRIAVERMRFNGFAQAFNARRDSFPANNIAGMFGTRFQEKSYFKAQTQAETAPQVKF